MIDLKKVHEYIQSLKDLTEFLEKLVSENLVIHEIKAPDNMDYLQEFTYLKDMLRNSNWPVAVSSPGLATGTEKLERAAKYLAQTVDLTTLNNQRVLDFGCGEGQLAAQIAQHGPSVIVGYDLKKQWKDCPEKVLLTKDLKAVEQNGPYDIVFAYDVLDHATNPLETLKQIRELKTRAGLVYLRCHPFVARHGTHLKKLNKAYAHLVFSKEELIKLGHKGLETFKVTKPSATYRAWFESLGMQVLGEKIIRQNVEKLFTDDPTISKRIKTHFPDSEKILTAQMEQQFIDYVIV